MENQVPAWLPLRNTLKRELQPLEFTLQRVCCLCMRRRCDAYRGRNIARRLGAGGTARPLFAVAAEIDYLAAGDLDEAGLRSRRFRLLHILHLLRLSGIVPLGQLRSKHGRNPCRN